MTGSQKHQIHVLNRDLMGKKVSKLRLSGQLPANIYGEEKKPEAITVKKTDLGRFLADAGEATLVYLAFDEAKKEVPVLIDEVQVDPVTSEFLHVSFKRVNLNEEVRAEVPLELVGESDVKGANVLLVKDVLEVEALPADLPEKITLDISSLNEIGQTLTLMDAEFDTEKVRVVLTEEELAEPLVIVQEQKEEEVEEVVDEAEGEDAETEDSAEDEEPDEKESSESDEDKAQE